MTHDPGNPNVLDRMMRECQGGAPLGFFADPTITDGRFVVHEPSEHVPWIVQAHPDGIGSWLTLVPHMHQCWIFEDTPESMAQRIREAGFNAVMAEEMTTP